MPRCTCREVSRAQMNASSSRSFEVACERSRGSVPSSSLALVTLQCNHLLACPWACPMR